MDIEHESKHNDEDDVDLHGVDDAEEAQHFVPHNMASGGTQQPIMHDANITRNSSKSTVNPVLNAVDGRSNTVQETVPPMILNSMMTVNSLPLPLVHRLTPNIFNCGSGKCSYSMPHLDVHDDAIKRVHKTISKLTELVEIAHSLGFSEEQMTNCRPFIMEIAAQSMNGSSIPAPPFDSISGSSGSYPLYSSFVLFR